MFAFDVRVRVRAKVHACLLCAQYVVHVSGLMLPGFVVAARVQHSVQRHCGCGIVYWKTRIRIDTRSVRRETDAGNMTGG